MESCGKSQQGIISLKRHLQISSIQKSAPQTLEGPSLQPRSPPWTRGRKCPCCVPEPGCSCVTQPGRLLVPQPCSLPGPLLPPERLDRRRQEMKQEEVRTPSTAPCPARGWHPPAQHRWGLPPHWGDLVPLPRLPPAVSLWPGVLVTALSEHSRERGWRGARGACPATYLPGHRTPAGDSRLLPAHAWHWCWHTPPPHSRAPHRTFGTGGPETPQEGAASALRRKERHAPRREGAPEETGEPRRREPRSGAAMAPEGEASTHVRRGWRPPASTGVPGTAQPSWGGAAAAREGEGG